MLLARVPQKVALLAPPLVVLLFGTLMYAGMWKEHANQRRVETTYAIIAELRLLLSRLKDAETAARGYALTGREDFLDPHDGIRPDIDRSLQRLRSLLRTPTERARLERLGSLVVGRLSRADTTVAIRRRGAGLLELEIALERGRTAMDAVRHEAARVEAEQLAALASGNDAAMRDRNLVRTIVVLGTVLTVALTFALNAILARYNRSLGEHGGALLEKNIALEEQAVELEIQASELEEQAVRLEEQAAHLEEQQVVLEEHSQEMELMATALRRQKEYLLAVIDSDPDAIFATDAEGRVRLANRSAAAMVGMTPEQVVGRMGTEVHPDPERMVLARQEDLAVLEEGKPLVVEERAVVVPATGETRWMELRKVPLDPPDGTPIQVLTVATDVTDRRRAEEEVRRSESRARRAQQEILVRLAQAAEFRDDDTGQHTRRVGRLAAAIARKLGRPDTEIELILQAAPLHDVGKIGIPDAILLKPARLTPEEYSVMKSHTVIGANLLSQGSSELISVAERIALSHHERWDGEGYPQGVAGEAIPLAARIVTVADVVDALSHDRPYRPAWTRAAVEEEIRRQRGQMFDPRCVDACLELIGSPGGYREWVVELDA